MIPLTLSLRQIDALASCQPGPAELEILRAGQDAKRRLLLLALRRKLPSSAMSDVDDAFDLLARAEAIDADGVHEILDRPLMDAWLARCIWGLKHRGLRVADVATDIRFLTAVAAAAATRAGLDFELRIPAPGGRVFLPGVGGVAGLGQARPVARSSSAGIEVIGADAKVTQGDEGWRPPHVVVVTGPRPWPLEIEDQDPYRDCFGYQPAEYLSAPAMADLSERMASAWTLIEADHPNHAAVIRASLRSVVPLAAPAGVERNVALSASSQLAYGSIAMLVPDDVPTLALLLIHEVQHMTLSGVLDVVDLYHQGGQARHHAPWRLDPRPIGPLLQGTFAHLGVTDFWRAHRMRESGHARPMAEFEFAYWRELTTRAIRALARSGELTPTGERFVQGLAATMDGWWSEPVPEPIAAAAGEVAEADSVLWRFHNQEPAPGSAESLAGAYRARGRCAAWADPVIITHQAIPARRRGLAAGIRDSLVPASPTDQVEARTVGSADHAYLTGDLDGAARAYRDRIAVDLNDADAWVGLAMTLRRKGVEPAATVLAKRPDLVRALCQRIRTLDVAVDELADWLSTGLVDLTAGPQGDGGSI